MIELLRSLMNLGTIGFIIGFMLLYCTGGLIVALVYRMVAKR
jgi:hypothetical protein